MPFPWAKNRVTRISQIVADLQSPKRAGSLVVETGFPTSLIDLVVKNRSRFRKHKSKKPVHPESSDPPPQPISPAPISPPELPKTLSSSEAPRSTQLVAGNVYGEYGVSRSGPEDNRVTECRDGSGLKTVPFVFLKILSVIVLVASVNKLTVGITLSAFALLLIEYAEKLAVSCSNLNAKILKVFIRSISTFLWFPKLLQLKTNNDHESDKIVVEAECRSNSSSFDEIEVVETKGVASVCSETQQNSNAKEVVDSCEISLCKTKGSRSVKFKSKMKKLVTKKLRCSMKEGKENRGKEIEPELSSEGSSNCNEDKSSSFEIQEKEKYIELENGNCEECKVEKVVMNKDKVGNSECVILFLITLIGLVMGRFPALMLLVTWCFMLKIVTTRGRSNVPVIIKCSVSKS